MALYTGRTAKYTRSASFKVDDLSVIASVKQGDFTDDNPYIFAIDQEVMVTRPDSAFYGMVGTVVSRRAGKQNRYKIRLGLAGVPFLQTELTAWRALPVPLWVTEGRWVDRVMVFGRTFVADDEIAARLLARERAHAKRQAAKRIAPQAVIELPKHTPKTAHEAVLPLLKWKIRQDYIKHIESRLLERKRWENTLLSSKEIAA